MIISDTVSRNLFSSVAFHHQKGLRAPCSPALLTSPRSRALSARDGRQDGVTLPGSASLQMKWRRPIPCPCKPPAGVDWSSVVCDLSTETEMSTLSPSTEQWNPFDSPCLHYLSYVSVVVPGTILWPGTYWPLPSLMSLIWICGHIVVEYQEFIHVWVFFILIGLLSFLWYWMLNVGRVLL